MTETSNQQSGPIRIGDTLPSVMAVITARQENCAKISVDDEYITLNYAYEYNIARGRCNTPALILGWAEHLSQKNWMTKERLLWFIQIAFELIGIEADASL